MTIDRIDLAPGLSISRVVTGLWQIADMERDGRTLDLDVTARAMHPYIEAGFTSFDMADHYGSAELIAGRARPHEGEGGEHVQLFTKWVPPPGPVTAAAARAAVVRSLERLRVPALDLLQFHAWNYADPCGSTPCSTSTISSARASSASSASPTSTRCTCGWCSPAASRWCRTR